MALLPTPPNDPVDGIELTKAIKCVSTSGRSWVVLTEGNGFSGQPRMPKARTVRSLRASNGKPRRPGRIARTQRAAASSVVTAPPIQQSVAIEPRPQAHDVSMAISCVQVFHWSISPTVTRKAPVTKSRRIPAHDASNSCAFTVTNMANLGSIDLNWHGSRYIVFMAWEENTPMKIQKVLCSDRRVRHRAIGRLIMSRSCA